MIAVIGDSLTVGAEPYLPPSYAVHAKVGRNSRTGESILSSIGPKRNRTFVWALGTNDGSYSRFRVSLEHARPLVKVTVTLYGVPFASRANRLIDRRFPSRCVVRWGRWARRHRSHMAGVHGDAVAYRARARMTVRAVHAC